MRIRLSSTIFAACAISLMLPAGSVAIAVELKPALDSITAEGLLKHVRALAADEFEGRSPGTKGEELTIRYLQDQFKKIGLKPGNPDGTYLQKVPLMGFIASPEASFTSGTQRMDLKFPFDYVAVSRHYQPETKVNNSDIVFVGYGVTAPEYQWDDFKDYDVRGKTVVMLVNDPPVPDPKDPTKLDDSVFKGRAMTYYGRWTYKYESASQKGAAAVLLVHETGPAGYPWEVISGSWSHESFDIQAAGNKAGRVAVEAWISTEAARQLFSMAGKDFEALKKAAVSRDFKPVPLNARANLRVSNKLRRTQSTNVIARLEGSDPASKNEFVIYTAHWDHLGKDEKLLGDQVFNGARDNATGTAALLELARAFTLLEKPPKRSLLFLAVTAEEKGLLGAKYYAENPLYPLTKTLADINMDGMNPWGRTKDVVVIGLGNSTLDDILKEEAARTGRYLKPDQEPEKGFFYRSDHFEFAKLGVPALDPAPGTEFVGKPPGFGDRKQAEYTSNDYHKVTDEMKPDWDLSGAAEDTQLLFSVGYRVAQESRMPEWKPGTEFKAKRDAALKAAGTSRQTPGYP